MSPAVPRADTVPSATPAVAAALPRDSHRDALFRARAWVVPVDAQVGPRPRSAARFLPMRVAGRLAPARCCLLCAVAAGPLPGRPRGLPAVHW